MAKRGPAPKERTAAEYEAIKASSAATQARIREAGRDIAPGYPAVVDPARKEKCRLSLKDFLITYLPETFRLQFSEDHLRVIGKMQTAVLGGGKFALAMPRGSGKTSITEGAAEWALLYGHRQFVVIIGAAASSAEDILESIKTQLSNNDKLLEDFPEACYPIRALEGIAHRCNGQTFNGARTEIGFAAGELVLPTIPDAVCSGARAVSAGITGQLRGLRRTKADGKIIRPDFIFIDDPQTDESANSLSQCATRERLISNAVMGMGGPGVKISAVMPCTVIRSGDLADHFLNREKHPEWNGSKMRLMDSLPTNLEIWERYADLRANSLRAHGDNRDGKAFYENNRQTMDAGARPSWPQRYDPDQVSAVQFAMDIRATDPLTFASEYQNEPFTKDSNDTESLKVDGVVMRVNGLSFGRCQQDVSKITAFIDVQKRLLYYCIVGWTPNFGGQVLEYGTFPDQTNANFTAITARKTLSEMFPGESDDAAIAGGIRIMLERLFGPVKKAFVRPDGVLIHPSLALIDANWGPQTNTVYAAVARSAYARFALPSRARAFGPLARPINEYERREGDETGHYWRIPALKDGTHPCREAQWDVNYWKTFVQSRLACAVAEKHAITLPGTEPERHLLFAEHMCSETKDRITAKGSGREVDQWVRRPNAENHWWDCIVGCAVAASICGVRPLTLESAPVPQNQRTPVGTSQVERRSIREFNQIQRNF